MQIIQWFKYYLSVLDAKLLRFRYAMCLWQGRSWIALAWFNLSIIIYDMEFEEAPRHGGEIWFEKGSESDLKWRSLAVWLDSRKRWFQKKHHYILTLHWGNSQIDYLWCNIQFSNCSIEQFSSQYLHSSDEFLTNNKNCCQVPYTIQFWGITYFQFEDVEENNHHLWKFLNFVMK